MSSGSFGGKIGSPFRGGISLGPSGRGGFGIVEDLEGFGMNSVGEGILSIVSPEMEFASSFLG